MERKLGNLTADANYVGTVGVKLPRTSFPNAYPGADPTFAPLTRFDTSGNVIGGFGTKTKSQRPRTPLITRCRLRSPEPWVTGGPGIQASYTWSKSIDDTSEVIGGTGSTGAVAQGFAQNPFDTHPERGPSSFDVSHGFGLSVLRICIWRA